MIPREERTQKIQKIRILRLMIIGYSYTVNTLHSCAGNHKNLFPQPNKKIFESLTLETFLKNRTPFYG